MIFVILFLEVDYLTDDSKMMESVTDRTFGNVLNSRVCVCGKTKVSSDGSRSVGISNSNGANPV